MSWVLVNADGSMAGAPTAAKPTPAKGQSAEPVPAGYPDTVAWSAAKRGWYDLMTEAQCLDAIDTRASTVMGGYLTIKSGRSDMYRRKVADVDRLNALGATGTVILSKLGLLTDSQKKAQYPFLWAEMKATGASDMVAARDVIQAAIDATSQKLADIEQVRRATKIAVRAATTTAAKNAAVASAVWPS